MSFLVIQFLSGLSSAALLFLVASGLTLVFGVTRILNFAHGSLYMLGAYISFTLTNVLGNQGIDFWLSIVLASGITALVGGLLEVLVLRRIYAVPTNFQLLATFALILIFQDLTLYLWGPEDKLGPQAPGLDGAIKILGEPFPSYDLLLIVLAGVVFCFLSVLLHKTRFGILIRAATEDREMLANLGVNQKLLFTAVFMMGSFLAGLGGALQMPRQSVSLGMDMSMIVEAFVIVVIGGMGSLRGAALASFLVGVIKAFCILVFSQATLVIVFVIMAAVLICKPHGLFGHIEGPESQKSELPITLLHPPGRVARITTLLIFLFLVCLPLIASSYGLVLATEILIFSLFSMSLLFILGPGGIGVLGHALYFGVGAYTAALMTKFYDLPMIYALVLAPLVALLCAAVFSSVCVRLHGIYQGMLTFAFAQMVWAVVFQWYELTGGDNGILGVWPSVWAADKNTFYYLTLLIIGASILYLRHLIFAPFGYALRAVRDNAKRAESIGLPSRKIQYIGLLVSAAFAGVAGGVFAYSKGSVFPAVLEINMTMQAFIMTLLGGVNTITGPLVGTGLYITLESEISRQAQMWRLLLGTAVLILVILFPEGIVGTISRKKMGLKNRSI